jgi:hypothetical protein
MALLRVLICFWKLDPRIVGLATAAVLPCIPSEAGNVERGSDVSHTRCRLLPQLFSFLSISILHFGPNLFIAQITENPLIQQITPRPVNSQPSPMALIKGWATTPPTQLKIFRMKLLTATPLLERLGMNLKVTSASISHLSYEKVVRTP